MISTPAPVSDSLRPKRVGRPRPTTDTRIAVDIREVFRSIGGNVGGKVLFRWNSNRVGQLPVATAFTLTSPELVTVTNLGGLMPDETLDVVYTPCHIGGRRAWFACTKLGCGKRVAILYDHPRGFRCRHCFFIFAINFDLITISSFSFKRCMSFEQSNLVLAK